MLKELLDNCTKENIKFIESLDEDTQIIIAEEVSKIKGFTGTDYNTINKVILPTLRRRYNLPIIDILNNLEIHSSTGSVAPIEDITKVFKNVELELQLEWTAYQEMTPSVYHKDGHGEEMGVDSAHFSKSEFDRLEPYNSRPKLKKCFCAFSKMVHTLHDLIQHLTPVDNEIKTYEVIRDKVFLLLNNIGITKSRNPFLYVAIDHAIWETIVVGTTFNFKDQVPLLYYVNEVNIALKGHMQFLCPSAIASIQLSIAVNDTRRCSQLSKVIVEYNPVAVFFHMYMCKGRNNHFINFAETHPPYSIETPREISRLYLQMSHLFGQNVRAKLELMLKNMSTAKTPFLCSLFGLDVPDDEFDKEMLFKKIRRFCLILKKSIDNCTDDTFSLAAMNEPEIEELFMMFVAMMRKEVDFARGFTEEKLHRLITSYHELMGCPITSYDMNNLNEWELYAEILEKYLNSLSTTESFRKKTIIGDWIILAANQIGNISLTLSTEYFKLLEAESRTGEIESAYHIKYKQLIQRVQRQSSVLGSLAEEGTRNITRLGEIAEDLGLIGISSIYTNGTPRPWARICKSLSQRNRLLSVSLSMGEKVHEICFVALGKEHPLTKWLESNAYNLYSAGLANNTSKLLMQKHTPSFITQYLCCCLYRKSLNKSQQILESLTNLQHASSAAEISSSLDEISRAVKPSDKDTVSTNFTRADVDTSRRAQARVTSSQSIDGEYERVVCTTVNPKKVMPITP